MNFGGGYQSMDTSSFGGGGFMDESSPSLDASQSKGSKSSEIYVVPCTVGMLQKATYNQGKDCFEFHDIELHQVRFVAIIREVTEVSTHIAYKLDDMTGPSIVARKWIGTNETQAQVMRRSECREDAYVRVSGHLKLVEGEVVVVIFTIAPVNEFDEITYHMLDVVYAYMMLKKYKSGDASGFSPNLKSPRGQSSIFNTSGTPMRDPYGGTDGGLTPMQRNVLNAVRSCSAEEGISVGGLLHKFSNVSEQQIKKTIDFLSNEGHIYSTIDDEHYRATSM